MTSERDEKRPLCIAALQMVSCCDLETNLQVAEELIGEAVEQGAKMVVLPENFALFGVRDLYSCGLEEATPAGPIRGFLRQMAQRYGIWLVGGTLPTTQPHPQIAARAEPADDSGVSAAETVVSALQNRVYAACFVVNSAGEEVGRYDKIHLFDVDVGHRQERYRESESFCHGGCPVVVDTPWGRLGLAVCYDIRLGSAIVSPWGEMLTERGQGEGIVIADIDLAEVAQARRRMPIHDHRQFTVVDL
ncbi:MAG: nitrilase-related carbon-nitrogen hydrolase [Exilibacterium sp.]